MMLGCLAGFFLFCVIAAAVSYMIPMGGILKGIGIFIIIAFVVGIFCPKR